MTGPVFVDTNELAAGQVDCPFLGPFIPKCPHAIPTEPNRSGRC